MENRSKRAKQADSNLKAMGKGERTSKKVSTIRTASGTSFRRKNANQYGAAEGGNDYTEKRVNRTDSFETGGTADSAENGGANVGGTLGSSMMKRGGGVDADKNLFSKGEVIFLFKGNKANEFYKNLSNLMPDHEITMVNDDKVQAFFGNHSDLEDAMKMAKSYGMTYQGKYANGGGLANVPESFPETDAMSYKKGGAANDYYEQLAVYVQGVGSIYNGTSMKKAIDKANSYLKKNAKAEIVISDEKYGDTYDLDGNMIEDKMATGGLTKGFEYSIGGL